MAFDLARFGLVIWGGRLHFGVKVLYTIFILVLVPFYLDYYGPPNFLWFCDIALLTTVAALWIENRFLASMQLIAVFLGSMIWLVDFVTRLATGQFLTGWTYYMFREDIPPIIRILSLFHGWLPFLLLWMVWRLGYDRRAWLVQTALAWVLLPLCYFFTDPIRNLNGVFGAGGEQPQTWVHPLAWLALMMLVYPVCVYLPSHLVLRHVFRKPGN
jgi:hypothetical protein